MKPKIVIDPKVFDQAHGLRPLDDVADKVLAYRAPARTTKAKKRRRKARNVQRESSN